MNQCRHEPKSKSTIKSHSFVKPLLYSSTYPRPNVDTLNTTTSTTTSHSLASFSTVYKLLHQHTRYNTTPLDYFDTAYTISLSPSSPKPSSKTSSIHDRSHVKRLTIHEKLLIHALTQHQSGYPIDILSLYLIIFIRYPFSYHYITS